MVMGEFSEEAEVLILGGGPGGYAAAFRAADLGLDVTLIDESGQPGGVCLFRGCIPSKALLYAAELISETRRAPQMGIRFGDPQIELEKLREWKDQAVDRLAKGLVNLCKKRGVQLVKARAAFEDAGHVRLDESDNDIFRIKFRHAIIATGSSAIALPKTEFKKNGPLMDSSAALDLSDVPQTLLVVGGGYVGAELGSVYSALGSRVTLVEMSDGLMPGVDRDLAKPLEKSLREAFEAIHLNTRVSDFEEQDKEVIVTFNGDGDDARHSFERVLVAVGRRPNSADIGLDNLKMKLDDNEFIVVDDELQTSQKNIYAIGDVVGGAMLAHKAMYEGRVAAEVIDGQPAAFDVRAVPAVVYTNPQVAWCGLTETEAAKQDRTVEVARFPWSASGRAATMGVAAGLTKLIIDPENGRILGVGIVGKDAGELIAEGVLAVEMGAVAEDVALSMHPHPSLSEAGEEAAEAFLGSATHILGRGGHKAEK